MKFDFVEIGSSCFKTLAEVFKDDDSVIGLSIEPVPELLDTIKKYCKESKNQYFLRCAVVPNKKNDFVSFFHTVSAKNKSISEAGIGSISEKNINFAIKKARFDVHSKVKKISVPAMTFQEIVEMYEIAEIGFLKIDAEGCDYDIVKSVLISNVKVEAILFEAEPFMTDNQQIISV